MIPHKQQKTPEPLLSSSRLGGQRCRQPVENNQSQSQRPTFNATSNMPRLPCNIAFIALISLIAKASTTTAALNVDTALSSAPNQAKTPTTAWLSKSTNRRIDNLSADDGLGALYVLSGDDILKYNKNLTLSQTIVGNRSNSSSGSSQDEITSIAFTTINHNELSLLLSCTASSTATPKTLACQLYRMELLRGKPIGWSSRSEDGQSIKLNIEAGPGEQMHILSGGSDSGDMLLTMSRPTSLTGQPLKIMNSTSIIDTNQGLHMPTLARFSLVTKPSSSLQISTVLPYKSEVGRTNDYVYLFRNGKHTHFVLNDISGTQSSVRLARVCDDDAELYSYTEISINCGGKTNLIAKTATLIHATASEPDLYVALEDNNSTLTTSYICKYSLSSISNRFDAAISQCHKASHLTKSLTKFYPDSSPQDCKLNTLSSDWCSSKINTYIDGTSEYFAATEDKFVEIRGISQINFLHVFGRSDTPLYFIGTKTGLFSKFNPIQDDVLYTVDLFTKRIKYPLLVDQSSGAIDPPESSREARYAIVSGDVIAATSADELHRLPMASCRFYRTCHVCMRVNEPDLCVWCDGMCSRERECSNATQVYKSHCPPHIERFEPLFGPISGHTRLTIHGQSFGSAKASLQVKLDDLECKVDKRFSSDNRIVCEVEPVGGPRNATVQITVTDKTGVPDIEGSASLKDVQYQYMDVAMYGLYPAQGPLSGGNVTIFGKNLAAGARRDIHLGDIECQITSLSNERIVCRTEVIEDQQADFNNKSGLLPTFKVDGQKQEFSYKPQVDGYELSKTYLFIEDTTVPAEVFTQSPVGLTTILVISAIVVIAFIIPFLLKRYDGLAVLKNKLPAALNSRSPSDVVDAKVMFRNPHSHMFNGAESSEMHQTDSLNGLIKLKGSVMSGDYFGKSEQLEQDKPLMQNFLDEETLTLLAREKILIDRNKLTLGHVLGSGQFGRVYKGFLKMEQTGEHAAVAVKTLHSRCHWEDGTDNQAFLEEGLMMKDFNHENVLALIGVAFDSNGLPMVITPFMLYGDLRSYISDEASSPSVRELIEFGIQVAKGMAYLSNQKFVHRDLAARNCMLDENLKVKVADFGLSRDIYERDYYSSDNKTVKLPVKWMAIESLEKSVYTTKSDVWSYGVLLWELMTRGVVPYPDVDNFDLYQYLKAGRRMYRPKYCPVIFYNLMLACWNENPALRPTFDELVVLVSDVITKLLEANDESGQQKVDKDETYCDVIR